MSIAPFDLMIFGIPALIAVGVALSAWQYRSNPGGTPLIIHGLGSAVWVLSYGAGTRLNSQLIAPGMLGLSWLAAVAVAFSGMYVAVEYTERAWLKHPAILGSIGGYLCLEALMIGLNPADLFYSRAPTVVQNGTPVYEFGAWWTVHLIVAFAAAAAMLGMFLEAYLSHSGRYRRQARAIVAGIAISYTALIIEVAGLEPYPDLLYNTTMVGDTILSVAFLWALFYADFLHLTPVARETLLEEVEDATVVTDRQGRLSYLNRTAQDLFGIDPEYVGMPADDVFIQGTNKRLDQFTDTDNSKTEIVVTPEDERRYFSVSASSLNGDRDRAFVFREITTLQRQNDRLEEFADVVAHDLRNPLTGAVGFLEIARKTNESQHFERVEQSLDRMEELIDELLMIARGDRQGVNIRTLQVQSLVEEAWSYTDTPKATLSADGPLGEIQADETRLLQLFGNLFRNSVEHSGDDVTVKVAPLADEEGFYVADDGPGFSDEKRTEIEELGETDELSGTGIGLMSVTDVVEAHGWGLSVPDTDDGARIDIRTGEQSG